MQQPLRRPTGTASTRSPTPPAASVADAPARHTVAPGCPPGLNKFSATITQPKSQGASQAMLYATGLREEDMDKPQIGISSVWYEGNPCNMHLMDLALEVKAGVEDAGMVGYRFNTIGVSDGISMGTDGMSYSLQSRDLIADSIETVMGAQWYDANISLPGCDKNMPGTIMAAARLDRPSLMIYGGTIKPGKDRVGEPLDIVSAFQSYGAFAAGLIDDAARFDILRNACPGAGACGGMYTANTMACAIEALGMTLPYSSSVPAEDPLKLVECRRAGTAMLHALQNDLRPSKILTRASFDNAIVLTLALGGSTNAVLHLLAIALAAGVPLTIDDFQSLSNRIPFIGDLKPSGKYVMEDLHDVGGTPAVLKYLLDHKLIDGTAATITGKSLADNLTPLPGLKAGQDVVLPLDEPIKETGHLQILYGNIAPGGCVGKITGKEGLVFEGVARVFDSEEDMLAALSKDPQSLKGTVIVIRYEGPKGGPGMPEMLTPTSAIMGAGLGKDCALITDGRFSGGSHGFCIGHVTPEAQEGGAIALIQDGDPIRIDADKRSMDVVGIDDAAWDSRRAAWSAPPLKATRGTLYKYIKCVSSASLGCVTDL